jgi:hypothetical protein
MSEGILPGPEPGSARALQRIEPLDSGSADNTAPWSTLPRPILEAQPPGPRTAPDQAPPPPTPLALVCRFLTASAALAYTGNLAAVGRAADVRVLRGEAGNGDWWIGVTIDLELGRQLAHATLGEPFVDVGGTLIQDRGWGPSPEVDDPHAPRLSTQELVEVPVTTLVRVAGLHPAPAGRLGELRVLLDGRAVPPWVRRGLDIGLRVSHRLVDLTPLFASEDGEPGSSATRVELRLAAVDGDLPPAFVAALVRDRTAIACRPAGTHDDLLIQQGAASPLPDHLLAALVDQPTWVLAMRPFGCWRLSAAGDLVDSAALIRLSDDYPIDPVPVPASTTVVTMPVLEVVPRRTPDRVVDAVLLDETELDLVPLILEGGNLSETALVVRGTGRHLLLAPGGLLERVPTGEPLYCLGPGPLYLPLGYGIQPRIGASGRRELFGADERTAVVLLPDRGLVFDLEQREPVWTLWAGELPPVDLQLSAGRMAELRAIADFELPEGSATGIAGNNLPARRRIWDLLRRSRRQPEPWQQEAMRAELSGDLIRAAQLHQQNKSLLRAARLFERAAREADDRGERA